MRLVPDIWEKKPQQRHMKIRRRFPAMIRSVKSHEITEVGSTYEC